MLETPVFLVVAPFLLGFVITLSLQSKILGMISSAGFVRPNFKQDLIPVGSGIAFPASLAAAYIPLLFFLPENRWDKAFIFLFVVAFAAFLGIIDDFLGSRETSGLKGHLGQLLKGRLTTGGFKAVWGGLMSLLVAIAAGPVAAIPLHALIMALTINAVNLLDLRPGRAGKAFILAAVLLVLAGAGRWDTAFLAVVLGSLVAFLPLDLKAKTMMGDAGSNALGAALGLTAVWILDSEVKWGLLLFLVAFHLFTEKYSLTKIIERNRFLNFLDTLGREK